MKKITIYTQSSCRHSDKLKQLLNSKKINFVEKDISNNVLLKREMIERTGGRAITPQIFVENRYMSNIDELHHSINNLVELRA
jgi:glutaredoxin